MGRAENKESTPLTRRKEKSFLLSTMTAVQFCSVFFSISERNLLKTDNL